MLSLLGKIFQQLEFSQKKKKKKTEISFRNKHFGSLICHEQRTEQKTEEELKTSSQIYCSAVLLCDTFLFVKHTHTHIYIYIGEGG